MWNDVDSTISAADHCFPGFMYFLLANWEIYMQSRWWISNQTKYGCQVLKFVFFALISVIWVNLQQMIV